MSVCVFEMNKISQSPDKTSSEATQGEEEKTRREEKPNSFNFSLHPTENFE